MRKEVTYNSKLVIIATATSRDSVHPTLLTSHGNHVFCKSIEIPLPSVDQRANMIYAILNRKDLSLPDDDRRCVECMMNTSMGCWASSIIGRLYMHDIPGS